MKKLLTLMIALLISSVMTGQSKKDCVKYHIKSTTTYETDHKDDPPLPWKDKYEEFDRRGNTVLLIEYRKDGSIKRKEAMVYNSLEDITELTEFDTSGRPVSITHYKYDSFGEKSSETVTDVSGAILKQTIYEYDKNSLKTRKTTTGKSGEVRTEKKVRI